MINLNAFIQLLISITLTSLLLACGGSSKSGPQDSSQALDPNKVEYKKYSDIASAYQIEIPSNWSNRTLPDFENNNIRFIAAFNEPRENREDRFLENVILIEGDFTQNESLPENLSQLKITSNSNQTIAGLDVAIETGQFKLAAQDVTLSLGYMTLTFTAKGKQYALQYVAELKRFNTYTEVTKRMLASLELGVVIGSEGNFAPFGNNYPIAKAAHDDNNVLIPYWVTNGIGDVSVFAKLINDKGSILKTITIAEHVKKYSRSFCSNTNPRAAFNGQEFILIYGEDTVSNQDQYVSTNLLQRKISQQGELLDQEPTIIATLNNASETPSHDIIFTGNKIFIAWYHQYPIGNHTTERVIMGKFLDQQSNPMEEFVVHNFGPGSGNAVSLKLRTDKQSILVGWHDELNSYHRNTVRATVLNLAGEPQYKTPVMPMADSEYYAEFDFVAIDQGYSLIWLDRYNICQQKLMTSGLTYNNPDDEPDCQQLTNEESYKFQSVSFQNDSYHITYNNNDNLLSVTADKNFTKIEHTQLQYPTHSINNNDRHISETILPSGQAIILDTLGNGNITAWLPK